jgi:hypothetical protein
MSLLKAQMKDKKVTSTRCAKKSNRTMMDAKSYHNLISVFIPFLDGSIETTECHLYLSRLPTIGNAIQIKINSKLDYQHELGIANELKHRRKI